ncbi:hypothetical protein MY5147_009730 [Beauveria neobassiana]
MDKVSKSLGGTSRTPPSRPPKSSTLLDLSNFDINAVLRGMQLTLVGGTSSSASESSYVHQRPLQAGGVCRRHRHRNTSHCVHPNRHC